MQKLLNGELVALTSEEIAQRSADEADQAAAGLLAYLQEFRALRMDLLNVLAGIALAEDLQAEFKALRQQLLDIPQRPEVVAATSAAEAKAAIKTEYARIVKGASPALVSAFKEINQ